MSTFSQKEVDAEARRRGFGSFRELCASREKSTEQIRDQMRKRGLTLDEALASRSNTPRRDKGVPTQARADQLAQEQATGVRTCVRCDRLKPLTDFTPGNHSLGGRLGTCRECRGVISREKLYSMTEKEQIRTLKQQNHQCGICARAFSTLSHSPHMDHDHTSKVFRGWLCRMCNWTVGCLEKPERGEPSFLAAQATKYLAYPPGVGPTLLGKPVKSPRKKLGRPDREHHLWANHDLSPDDFTDLFARQGQRCAICLNDTPRHPTGWRVDHDPNLKGRVSIRGVLCNPCNLLLGHAEVDIQREFGLERLNRAAAYIEAAKR